jgi:NADH-quinone oxidoreductase subunit A
MALEYGPVGLFAVGGIVFALVALVIAYFIRPADIYARKLLPYECGIVPLTTAWHRVRIGYYVIALLFLIFEVEAAFLFPWAVVLRDLSASPVWGLLPIAEMGIFVAILLLGLIYAWRKGDLQWN